MKTILFVDGYNVIGNWEHLERIKRQSIAQARDQLLEELADYIAYTGYRTIVVFDAQFVQGKESESMYKKMKIVFTEENRIADEYIEAHARDYMNASTNVIVATSDATEQWQIFGQGALRLSARELLIEIREMASQVQQDIKAIHQKTPKLTSNLDPKTKETLERWRRGSMPND
ncbi:NYN domain-containing protein [Brochothrix thermosphacta]|uniref:NYN domain-containing protein n=1 Tax=Brochothrix thermosphacta TaxID=2756 RepID=UPI0003E8A930|nr:NYN domain-containing protein [Brochothrix thermosphacta]EUJ34302.1 hypothetical protein BTHER_12991 [Brochothrix thermosphacta DSM 20171 = FSL F6-1036]ODJ50892.1 hypothetical protein BFR34_02365 [Brochothrix thermosphacta DSM 20171 = FSL F6-1036]ODJ55466.1 hypothetical protein BFR38_08675 [Brochothrix thermosphacta]ODJ56895.1 hypothetical protein BFR44_11355 [Brochothrix thermosphacta]ODJ61389.1 hypothetical protein BFR42_08765 [Brochothrix thermosphacta]